MSIKKPKVLLLDIETAPILGYVWGLFDQNVALNQIYSDWHILSWSAKWLDEDKIMYADQRYAKDVADDRRILKQIWKLLDEADVIITQNGKNFDAKKLNARFVLQGLKPPSSYKHIDTFIIAKKHFAFTSNKLEYLSDKLCTKFKKLKPKKFQGFEMWKACLNGNMAAWREMEKYNKHDVLALEELYKKLIPWDNTINFNVYHDNLEHICQCGSKKFRNKGYYYTATSKFKRYKCVKCGSEIRDRVNELSKDKRKSLKLYTVK